LAFALMAGTGSCGPCHGQILESYSQTAHSRTSSRAAADSIRGSFTEGQNILHTGVPGVYFRMERRGDSFYQTGFDQGRSMSQRFDLVIGSGRRGQSYLYWRDRLLYQLPVSYFALTGDWINSPGYKDGEVHFERPIPPQCLGCHSTQSGAGPLLAGITCQKCHGSAEKHPQIGNPARLDRDRRVALCATCHSGIDTDPKADVHGNQVGLLRRSQCFQKSAGMSCSTCHNVHRAERGLAALSAKCVNCHAATRCKKAADADNCIDCHMPRQPSQAITFRAAGKALAQSYRTHAIGIY
jgi:Doubled CXXCH motif (Paired_CXXCH_1)